MRDPTGHSYQVEPILVAAEAPLGSDVFLWGLDLFNHGYYWEAHEAWEGLWQVADRDGPLRILIKGLRGSRFESANMWRLRLMPDGLRLCFIG
jgi:hypothetical protein